MPSRIRKTLSAELAAKIRFLAENTDLFQHQIAAALDINQGRVSEVLNNKRYPK